MQNSINNLANLITKLNLTTATSSDNETTQISTTVLKQINALVDSLIGRKNTMAINTGSPVANGVYVAYVDSRVCKDFPHPDKVFLAWNDGYWYQRGCTEKYKATVHGWIGPMPTERIVDLQRN